MSYQEILYDVSDRIATVTLNRPDKLNAWTAQMGNEVRSAMEAADAAESVRVIVLTGAGKGFCAGADMGLLAGIVDSGGVAEGAAQALRHQAAARTRQHVPPDFQGTYSYFPGLRKPVIGAINGHAVGLGMVVSLYCDLRFASTEAKFSTAFARRGLIAEYGIAWMLPRLVGLPNALDLLLSARTVGGEEALRIGLVRHWRRRRSRRTRPCWRAWRRRTSRKAWRISWRNAPRPSRENSSGVAGDSPARRARLRSEPRP